MTLDDVAGDRQAEPGAAGVAGSGFVEAGEAFEDELPIVQRDPGAVVTDGQPDATHRPRRG